MEEDDIRYIYDAIGGEDRLKGSYESFERKMADSESYRKVVFKELGGNDRDTDTYVSFNNNILKTIKKKSPSGTESNQSGSKAQSISANSQQGNQIPNTEATKTQQTNQLDQFTDSLIEPALDVTKTPAQAEPPKQKEKSIAEIMGMMPKSILPEGASPSQEQAQREMMKPVATSILQYGSEKPLTKPKTGMFDGVPTLVVPKKDKAKYGDEFEGQKVMTDEELFQTTLTKSKTEIDRELLSEKENIALDLLEDKVKTGLSNTYLTKPLQEELGLLNQINELQALPPSEENARKLTSLMFEKDKLESKRVAPILSYIKETDAVIAQYDELIKNSKGDTSSLVKDRKKLLKKRNELSDDTKPFFQRAEEKLAELNETVFADPRYDNLTPQGKLQRYLILKHDELQDLKRQQAQEKGTNALTATGFAINELLNALDMDNSSVSPEIREIERELGYLAPTAFLNIAPRLGEELEPERLFKQIPAEFSDYLKWADTRENKATIIRDALNKSYISSGNMNPDVIKTLETQEAPTWREPNFYGDLLASSTAIGLKLAGGNVGIGVAKAIKPISAAYERLMNVSKVFKTAKAQRVTREVLDTSVKFKTTAMLFDGEDEQLDGFTGAFNGLASAVVSPALANMANKLKSEILKKVVTPLAAGAAETTQETSEMIGSAISAFVDSGDLNKFLEPIKAQVGTLDKAAGFVISTFGMGMAFGVGKSVDSSPNPYLIKAMEDYMKLPLDQQQQVDKAINAMTKDADAKDVLNMTEAHAEDIMNEVRETVKEGNLTEEEAEQIKSDLTVAVRVNERVPTDLPIEKKANIVPEIGAKIALEDKMKTSDKVFHDEIKADIEVIDQIIKTKLSIEEQGQTEEGSKKETVSGQTTTKETAKTQTEQGAVGATEQGQQLNENQPIGTQSVPAVENKPVDGEGVLKQKIKDFGVSEKMVDPVNSVVDQIFKGLKSDGLVKEANIDEWLDIKKKGIDKEDALKKELVNEFYSPLEKIIGESKLDKLPTKQWIEKFGKGEEAKWTGLNKWLSKQEGSVSKADIQKYLTENRVEIKEVVKKTLSFSDKNKIEEIESELEDLRIKYKNESKAFLSSDKESYASNMLKKNHSDLREKLKDVYKGADAKFPQYQLEGEKENYKEVLVTMPSKGNFKSSHFDELNILVHLRMNTRTDAEGKRVLFLEEVQSDWGQEGKKKGFEDESKNNAYDKIAESYNVPKDRGEWSAYVLEKAGVPNDLVEFWHKNTIRENNGNIPQAPFVTDTNAWTKLALKVALKEAVKQGATKIAWTTGEQQNERYDLSKQVDKINVESVEEVANLFFVDIELSNGNTENLEVENGVIREGNYKGQRLDSVIGKDYADKILSTPSGESKVLEGADLKVGGKGMKGFYGSPKEGSLGIVGNIAKSLFKQEPKTVEIGRGSKVEYEQVDRGSWSVRTNEGTRYFTSEKDAKEFALSFGKNNSTQHSIDITPELIAQVEGGQPLFKEAQAQYRIESGKNIIEALQKFNGTNKAVTAITHEIMHPTVVAIINGAKDGNEIGLKHANTIVSEFNKVNPKDKITLEQLIEGNDAFINGSTKDAYRNVQEFIAISWENYHMQGAKGFSQAFQDVLDQITKAFKAVYKSLTGDQITPELKDMFDEILGKRVPLFNRQRVKELLKTKNYVKEQIPQIQKSIINNLKDGSDLTIAEAKFLNENALDSEIAKLKKELDESITKDANNLNVGVGIPFNTLRSLFRLAEAYAKKGIQKLKDVIKIAALKNKNFIFKVFKEKTGLDLSKAAPVFALKTYTANKIFIEIWDDVDLDSIKTPEQVLKIIKEAAAAVITVKNNSKGNKKDFDAVIDLLRENYIDIKANGVGGIEFLKKKLEDYKAEQNKAISIKDKYNAKDWLVAFMSDKMLGIKYLTEAGRKKSGGVLEDEYNIYDLFDLVIGKASNELSKLRTELFGSEARVNKVTQDKTSFVYKYLNSKGISVDDFNNFLKAQHMREFNERAVAIRKMQNAEEIVKQQENIEMYNKGDYEASTKKGLITKAENIIKKLTDENFDDLNGGFSSDEADKRMAEIKKDTERYENLQQAYKEFKESVLDRNIEESFESGLIDEEARNRLIKGESMTGVIFDLYVPLKVREDVIAAEKKDSGLGSFFGFKKIKGTSEYSEFLRVDPFQQSVAELEATIKAKHKNILYNHFFDFMERFPNEDLYELIPQKKDERGRDYTDGVSDKNSVQMKRKGKVFYLKFNHPKLRRSLINDFWTMPEGMRKVISAGNFFMNFKRMNLTTRNIDFTLPNWIRDSMSVLVNSTAEEKEGLGREIFKQMAINSPITITREGIKLNKVQAVPALRTALGIGTEEDQAMFDEMGVEGSFVGYMNYAKGDLAIQELSDAVEKAEGGGNVILNGGRTVIAAIDYINTAVELSTRFAVYKACRTKGYSKQQSAVMAKNIGINFNRKGELGGIVNMLYLFSNAGIQDTSNFARRITKSRKMQAASLVLLAGSYAFTALQYALMDEEEIDKNQFKIQQYFLFPTGKKDRYITMPKAYGGIRVIDQMGRSLYEVTHKEKNPLQAGGELWDAFLSFANPVSGSTPNWQSGIVPTFPKMFVEVNYLNKDWKNSPISPETYGKEIKDVDNYFAVAPGESTFHITTAKQLEKLGLDISPETIEYLFKDATGGMIGVTKNATIEAYQLITDPKKELDFNNVPVARRFISFTGKKDWGIYLYFRDNAKKGKVSKEELAKLLDYGYKSIKNGTMKFETGERKIKALLKANGYDKNSIKYGYHHEKLRAMDPEK